MTNLDGQCQGGPEGEKYPKTTGTGKATQKTKKGSLEESCESLIVGAADGREERRRRYISLMEKRVEKPQHVIRLYYVAIITIENKSCKKQLGLSYRR